MHIVRWSIVVNTFIPVHITLYNTQAMQSGAFHSAAGHLRFVSLRSH